MASLAVLVGSAEAVRPMADLDELARLIDFSHISRAPAKFDESELEHLNARLIHEMPYEAARERLAQLDADEGEAFWNAVRGNLTKLRDAAEWAKVVRGPVTPVIEDKAFIEAATGALPAAPWDAHHLESLDRGGEGRHRRQGQGPVHAACASRSPGSTTVRSWVRCCR